MKTQLIFTLFLLLNFFMARQASAQSTAATGEKATAEQAVARTSGEDPSQGRDPFSQVSARIVKPDHDQAAGCCLLRGIIKVDGRCCGLFGIGGKADNSDKALYPLAPGATLRIMFDKREYIFTISRFNKRSVVITGENGKKYQVRL